MTQNLLPLALDSANRYLNDSEITPGELIGGMIGSTYGPIGAFVGGTVGRMVESKFND
ncbi:MAG: hypothetical protein PHH11_09565 [Methylomonas sp.]|nr:hypothetical protein [Methylomonas sp.]